MNQYQIDQNRLAPNVGLPAIELKRKRAQNIKEQQRIVRSMTERHNQQLTRYLETQKQIIEKRWQQEAIKQEREKCHVEEQSIQNDEAIEFYENVQKSKLQQLKRRNSFNIELKMRKLSFNADLSKLNEQLRPISNDVQHSDQVAQKSIFLEENKSDQQGALKKSLSLDKSLINQIDSSSPKQDVKSLMFQALAAADPLPNNQIMMLQNEENKYAYENSSSASSESLSAKHNSSNKSPSVHSDSPQHQKSLNSSFKDLNQSELVCPVPSSNQRHFSQIYSQFELFKYQASPQLIKLQKCEIDDVVAGDQQAICSLNRSLIDNVLEYPSQLQVQSPIEKVSNRRRRARSFMQRQPRRSKNMILDQKIVKDVLNMRQAIKDLKRRCNSAKNKVEVQNGRRIHKMLYSIKEREENVKASGSMEDMRSQEDIELDSPVIGESNNIEIKKVYQNCHKSLKEFQIGVDSKSEYMLSEQKLNIKSISQKLRKLSQEDQGTLDLI